MALAAPTIGVAISPLASLTKPATPGSSALETWSPPANDRRSMPAQKALVPVPVSTMTRTSGSASAATAAAPRARISAGVERVAGVGPVEAQHRDAAAPLDDEPHVLGRSVGRAHEPYSADSAASAASCMSCSTIGPKACSFSSSPARWNPCSSTTASFHLASTT